MTREEYYSNLEKSKELYHHGVKGQKWGVRRYQNPDGTLTAKGRKHMRQEQASQALTFAKGELQNVNTLKQRSYNAIKNFAERNDYDTRKLNEIADSNSKNIVSDEFQPLFDKHQNILNAERNAINDVENVKSYIKGISGQRLKEFDFKQGENGRQYLNDLLRRDVIDTDNPWNSKYDPKKKYSIKSSNEKAWANNWYNAAPRKAFDENSFSEIFGNNKDAMGEYMNWSKAAKIDYNKHVKNKTASNFDMDSDDPTLRILKYK